MRIKVMMTDFSFKQKQQNILPCVQEMHTRYIATEDLSSLAVVLLYVFQEVIHPETGRTGHNGGTKVAVRVSE